MKKKIEKNTNEEEFFEQFSKSIPPEVSEAVDLSMSIASQINFILKKDSISQREFAHRLGKKESEISKWLSGNHNFTTNTLGKIQAALGEQIITVPIYAKKEIKIVPAYSYSQILKTNESETIRIDNSDKGISSSSSWQTIINCNSDCYGSENSN